jgi:hypothetical protein
VCSEVRILSPRRVKSNTSATFHRWPFLFYSGIEDGLCPSVRSALITWAVPFRILSSFRTCGIAAKKRTNANGRAKPILTTGGKAVLPMPYGLFEVKPISLQRCKPRFQSTRDLCRSFTGEFERLTKSNCHRTRTHEELPPLLQLKESFKFNRYH